jgi:hypothetical protein
LHDVEDAQLIVLGFAHDAATTGWNSRTLNQFCERHNISPQERLRRWPAGVRSLGWELNDYADNQMISEFGSNGPHALSAVLMNRFAVNAALKSAVRSLAWSDLLHPIGTLRRTAKTAELMWRCENGARSRSKFDDVARVWLLVVVYSLCVLAWLCDRSSEHRLVRRMISVLAPLMGST